MSEITDMACRGRNKARFAGAAHHLAAESASRKNTWLGVVVVVFTSVVGTSIFASLSDVAPSRGWELATGSVSLLAAVLAALQTFFQFAELAQKHLAAASEYLTMRRKFDLFLVRQELKGPHNSEQELEKLEQLLEELENITKKAPVLSDSLYSKGKAKVMQSEYGETAPMAVETQGSR